MRILIIHQFYRSASASGENLSVTDEVAGLRARGHEVEFVTAHSDELRTRLDALRAGLDSMWSSRGVQRVSRLVTEFRPQVALCENLFPSHSPAALAVLAELGVPTVAGVRSFRMDCVSGTHYRNGATCTECVGSKVNFPAVKNGCYQGSRVASLPMAVSLRMHRPTFRRVDHFLPVSRYMADFVRTLGVPPGRITVRPNYVHDRGPADGVGEGFLYAGRLSEEKGFGLLLDAWEQSSLGGTGARLVVCGQGPLAERARTLGIDAGVDVRGMVTHDEVLGAMADTAVTVVPSLWAEPFGRVAIEAASLQRPTVVFASGGLADIVVDGETGWVAQPTVDALAAALRAATDAGELERRGAAARSRYSERYTEKVSLDILENTLEAYSLRA